MDDRLGRTIKPGDFGVMYNFGQSGYGHEKKVEFVVFGGQGVDEGSTAMQSIYFLISGQRQTHNIFKGGWNQAQVLRVPKSAVPKNLYSEKNPKWQQLLDAGIGVYVGKS